VSKLREFLLESLAEVPRHYREMIGIFGWLDTPMPTAAYWAWSGGIVAFLTVAMSLGSQRQRGLMAGLAVAVVASCVVVSTVITRPLHSSIQGRWILPLAVAVPVVAGEVLGGRRRPRRAAPLATTIAVVVAAVHVVALWWFARRNAVGTAGSLWFPSDSRWAPPGGWLPVLLLTLSGAVMLVSSVVAAGRSRRDEER
jgi:hypothetical protein